MYQIIKNKRGREMEKEQAEEQTERQTEDKAGAGTETGAKSTTNIIHTKHGVIGIIGDGARTKKTLSEAIQIMMDNSIQIADCQ